MIKPYYGISYHNKPITEKQYIELLDILQANGETIESFYEVANNTNEFCGIYKMSGCYEDNTEVYNALMEHHIFLSDNEFIDWILEKIQEDKEEGEDYAQHIHDYTYGNSDTQIYKTAHGYVIRFDF
jgi:hypothetical protein